MIFSWFELVGPWGSPTKMQRHQEERLTAVEPEKRQRWFSIPAPDIDKGKLRKKSAVDNTNVPQLLDFIHAFSPLLLP